MCCSTQQWTELEAPWFHYRSCTWEWILLVELTPSPSWFDVTISLCFQLVKAHPCLVSWGRYYQRFTTKVCHENTISKRTQKFWVLATWTPHTTLEGRNNNPCVCVDNYQIPSKNSLWFLGGGRPHPGHTATLPLTIGRLVFFVAKATFLNGGTSFKM